ncbi:MAG: nucleoside 2-deoxyribosyltransferase [Geobacter sp.]|nr:nucleoside 2-deoxyribosyltransferase [Geobacter sp.]
MISIVGGTYYENCVIPAWNYLFGSGLRAAATLGSHCPDLKLHTYSDSESICTIAALSASFNFDYETTPLERSIRFHYMHPFSVPTIFPPRHSIQKGAPINVSNKVVLRFGMMEGDAIVSGCRVVYDPQSAENPVHYHENGSTADKLAIVANMREGKLLTGESCHKTIAAKMLADHNYDVVIIKRGSFGAYVATKTSNTTVPAYQTNRVWPIGSGDVFSALFMYFWGVVEEDAFKAAEYASRGTAYYCSQTSLPVPIEAITTMSDFIPILPTAEDTDRPRLVYLAGPFFNMGELWVILEARQALLSQGLRVFSPLHDVGRGCGTDVAPADLEGLDRSTVVFAVVNGIDPGTIFEIGYARAKGIPVVVFVQNEKNEDLKMIEGSNCSIFNDFSTAIYHAAWKYHTS